MSMSILGTGSFLPEKVLTNKHLEQMVETNDEWIVTRTGIKERHIDETDEVCGMGVKAAKEAMKDAGVRAEDLKMIVVATVSASRDTPTAACDVMRMLGASCPAYDINAACSGFLYGMHMICNMNMEGPVLLIGADKLSRIVDYTDRSTSILFGDGAGAVILGEAPGGEKGYINSVIRAYPDETDSLVINGINNKKNGELAASYIEMDGREVYKFATRVMAEITSEGLDEAGFTTEDITWFIPHQANIRIIKAAAQRLQVDMSKFYVNIERVGNTSSASVAIALDELNKKGLLHKGDKISLTAFGGGLTAATAVVEWVKE